MSFSTRRWGFSQLASDRTLSRTACTGTELHCKPTRSVDQLFEMCPSSTLHSSTHCSNEKFRAFFRLPPKISVFFPSLGGFLVEFWWCLKRRGPRMYTCGVREEDWGYMACRLVPGRCGSTRWAPMASHRQGTSGVGWPRRCWSGWSTM